MDGRKSKILDYAKQNRNKPCKSNKNLPRGLLFRELGFKQRQDGIATEFQATAEDNLVFKFLEELHCQLPGASRSTFLMVFSPDGKKVASTHGNHNVYVTDLTTGKNVNTLSGHPRTPWCIAFHPSSNQILASGCLGGQVRVWDLHGGSELWMADGQTVIASLAFHPTDRLLVIATYNELHFWDWSQPEPFTRCYTNNEKEKVRYVAFDPLGHKLITGISNAPQVQTQWDRVLVNTPTNPDLVMASTSQAHQVPAPAPAPAPQSQAASMMPPERERRITVCYRSLVEQYEQLMQRYFDLSRSRVIPTMDRGTDPMDLEAESSSVGTRARERDRDRDRDHVRMRDRDRVGDTERDRSQERELGGDRSRSEESQINRERTREVEDRAHDSANSRERESDAERDHRTIRERDSAIAGERERGGNGDRDHNHGDNRERGCSTDGERDRGHNTDGDRDQNHPVNRYVDPTDNIERDNRSVERQHDGEERDNTINRESDRNRDHDHSYNRSNVSANNREQDNNQSGNRDGYRDQERGGHRDRDEDHDLACNSEQSNDHSVNRDRERDHEHGDDNRNRDQDHAESMETVHDHSGEREDNDQSGSVDQERDHNRVGCSDENHAGDNRDSVQGSDGDRARAGASDHGDRDKNYLGGYGTIPSIFCRGNNNNSNSSSSTGGDRSISDDKPKSIFNLRKPWSYTNINITPTTATTNSISSSNSNSVLSTDPCDNSTTRNTNNDNSSGQSGFSFDTCDSNLTPSNNNNNSSGSSGHSRDRVFPCGACDTNSNIHHDSSDNGSDRHTCRHAFPEMVDSWLKCTRQCQWTDRGRQASTNSEQDAATSSTPASPRPTAVPTERSRQELSRSRVLSLSMDAPRPIPWPDHPRLASGEAQTPGSDPNSATRDVAVGPTPRQEDPTSQGATPSADSSRSEFPTSETSAHYCVFGRLHSQAQPAPPASPEQSGRRFFVSRRSAFQPRSPRSDPPPSPSTTPPRIVSSRYLFQRRFPGTDTSERERPEPEGRPTSPLTPMQRARLDMTDVGVRYGIQLLSRHIDNMQRLCRARLEILQLQQIRRLWEDLQRQIRSLHLAVRESTIALTGAAGLPSDGTPLSPRTSPNEDLGLGRGRAGQPRNSQAEGTREENSCHLPNVSQMLEMARISDTSPQATSADNSNSSTSGLPRQTNPTTFTTSHLKSMMRARHLRAVKEALQSLSTEPGSSMASNVGNRDQPCSSSKLKPGPIKSCLKSGASSSSKLGRVTFSSDSSNIAWDTTEIISSNTTQGGNNTEENNASNATSDSAVNIENKQSDKSQHCPKKSYFKLIPSTSLKSGKVTFSLDNKSTASSSTEASSSNVTEGINNTGSKSNSKCNVNRLRNEDTGEQSHTDLQSQNAAPTADVSVTSALDASGSTGRTDATAPSRSTPVESRPSRGGFWLVSTMDLTQPVPTTSTARTPTVTTPSPSVSGPRPSSFQMLQQRLLRIRSKVYLRRPRLLALGPRSMRRQPSLSRSHSSRLFRHESGDRRPWFMQSVGRPQRSVNTAAQVGSSTPGGTKDASESSHNPIPMESSNSAGDSSTQTNLPSQTDPQPGPSRLSESTSSLVTRKTEAMSEDSTNSLVIRKTEESKNSLVIRKTEAQSEGSTNTEGSAARARQDISEGATVQKPTADSCGPCPTEEAGTSAGGRPSTEPRPPNSASRPSSSQQEPSTSESLLSMIARLERLVQQQREQRESIRSELSRERERESSNQSRRTNMWGLRVRPPWLRAEINSGSDSDSNPESERPQSWAGLSEEERLAFRQNSSSSRRNRPSQLDHDWEWTRESTRLRARQVLSLMVESLTQFFEENGLSNNTPHAVLDEQIYNLYVLLQLALELTDLLLAQLVSTRRELEHQWVHRLRSPVALDVNSTTPTPEENSGASGPSQARERDRDREQRGSRGAREDPTLLFRQCFPYLCSGAGRSERHSNNRQEDSLRRLSARLRDVHPSRVRCVRGVTTRSLGRVMMARGDGPPRGPMRVSPGSSPSPRRSGVCHPPGSSGIMVRVQQYQQQPTPSPAPGPSTRPGAPQQPDAFTVPLVQVNDVLIPDTSMLLNQPRTRPQSPPPSAMHSPFLWARESRVGTWPELWRPRYLHPRYVGPGYYTDEQEEPFLGFPSENFNFIRGSSIVPDTVIITDAPMSPNHRIQVWDFSKCNIPDISNAEKNVIVAECKIHNDASVDVSSDGRLLVTLLPSGRLSVTTMLGVYSLQWESLGQCLYTTSFEQNAVSVSLSPTSRFLLVGLASRRVALLPSDRNTMAQIFELEGARPGRSVGGRGRLFHVRNIEQDRGHGYMSLNCIRWAPGPGQGFVYGTNTGQLKVLR